MKIYNQPEKELWPEIIQRPLFDISDLHLKVRNLLYGIRQTGEEALREYTRRFDGVEIDDWQVSEAEFEAAEKAVPDELKNAIRTASANIAKFHAAQISEPKKVQTTPGVYCWQKAVPIEKVGLYIPGGSAPLFSTVLMLTVPAKLAGCGEIILCTPPAKDKSVNPAILFAARHAGATKVFKLGGIQAIGAMAYGVVTPKADKIFGPGNQFVMAAKQLVGYNDVAIDMPAGPSEVMVIADETSNPEFIAADLLSQAEHGPDSQVFLILKGGALLQKVQDELDRQLKNLPRQAIAAQALENSRIVVLKNDSEIIEMINQYAPEHLIISTNNYVALSSKVVNAGSVFLGNYTPESAGDYASGTNHTLPTNGWTRAFSGINMDSFVKKITFQEITTSGLKNLGPTVEVMAEAEQLDAHKNAVSVRLKQLSNK